MKLYSIIDILREKLYSLSPQDAFFFIEELEDKKQGIYLELIVSDALKILAMKNELSSFCTPFSKNMYIFLKDADIDEVKFYMEDNVEWFINLYNQARSFYQMPIIDRCLMMRLLLKKTYKKPLLEVDLSFILDNMVYKLRKELDDINDYYQDYIMKNGIESLERFYLLTHSILEELKREDSKKFEDNWMEMIRKFYISYKYTEHVSTVFIPNGAVTKQILEKENLQEAKEIIYALPDLFCEVLSFYFSYTNDEQFFDKKELDDFSKENISLEMKKKLHII